MGGHSQLEQLSNNDRNRVSEHGAVATMPYTPQVVDVPDTTEAVSTTRRTVGVWAQALSTFTVPCKQKTPHKNKEARQRK